VPQELTLSLKTVLVILFIIFLNLGGCYFKNTAEYVASSRLDFSRRGEDTVRILPGARVIFHFEEGTGLLFPMMMGSREIYMDVSSELLVPGSSILLPGQGSYAYACEYRHPHRYCTDEVRGNILVRQIGETIQLAVVLNCEDSGIHWYLDRDISFERKQN
jgi:hypothetical protein